MVYLRSEHDLKKKKSERNEKRRALKEGKDEILFVC